MVAVFVSHGADADAVVAARLAQDLRAARVEVWMAPGSIRPGELFAAAIDRGLQASGYFLVLLSPASMASRWVQTEIYAAIDRAERGLVTVLPLVLTSVSVPPLLSTFQQIDFSDYDRGLSALGKVLGVQLRPSSAAATAVPPTTARQPLPDAFVATALAALESGAASFGYLIRRVATVPGSILDAVVEVALLRIGVTVRPSGAESLGRVLAKLEAELRGNPHRVAALLAILSGEQTSLQQYQLLDAGTPNSVLLTWRPADGSDALGAAVPVLVELVTGRGPAADRS
jgi:hypothetical protein